METRYGPISKPVMKFWTLRMCHIRNTNFALIFYVLGFTTPWNYRSIKRLIHFHFLNTDSLTMSLIIIIQLSLVQSLSSVQLFATPWIAARQASLSITNSWSSRRLKAIESVMPSRHLILRHPFLLVPPISPSIRVFSSESALHMRWPKYWSFSFSISPSNEHPGLISFRMDWLDLPAVQGTLKSLLQHHSSKASILRRSAFFTVHLSHPYLTTGKAIALTRGTFVGKVISLLFNMLSRLVITYLSRNKSFNFMAAITICSDFGATQK